MKYISKRIAKGMAAIFFIKLVLAGGFLIFQSCQTEENLPQIDRTKANDAFFASLRQVSEDIYATPLYRVDKDGTSNARTSAGAREGGIVMVCFHSMEGQTNDVDPDSIRNIRDAVDTGLGIKVEGQLNDGEVKPFEDTEPLFCFEMIVEPTEYAVQPAIDAAKVYFKDVFGWDDNDIAEVLDGEGEYTMVPVAIALANHNEDGVSLNQESMDVLKIFGMQSAHASSAATTMLSGDFQECFMSAIGADVLVASFEVAAQMFVADAAGELAEQAIKTLAKKAFKEVAKKILGPIGLAIAAVEFITCMW